MKKVLTVLFATAVLWSCGDNGGADTKEGESGAVDTTPAQTTDPAAGGGGLTVDNQKGLELIGASDCTTCHAIDRKIIGPSYVDVAKKYENNQSVIDTLVAKIKKGGMGNWGNIPMTPHPDLADADAQEMVKYILSLKNQ